MKKIFTFALSLTVLLCATLGLSACGETKEASLEDCEIGYQVHVYPEFAFNYSLNWDDTNYLFYIESITVTLTEKKSIDSETTLAGTFYPYTFQVSANATTTSELAGRLVSIRLLKNDALTMLQTTIQPDGKIEWSQTWYAMSEPLISFSDILLYNQ